MAKDARKLAGKQYYTVSEAAYILGVTPLTLRNWDKSGRLAAARNPINNYRMYRAGDIERFLREMSGGGSTVDIV